jgi:hypothetical protein
MLTVALFGLLLFLRVRFPHASRGSETAVLVSAAILFFSVCNFLLPTKLSTSHRPVVPAADTAPPANR